MFKKISLILGLLLLVILSGCVADSNKTDSNGNMLVNVVEPTDVNGNIEVIIQDQYSELIDLELYRMIDNITLIENTNVGNHTIKINTLTLPVVGNVI